MPGRGWQCGRSDSARRDPTLYFSPSGQAPAGRCTDTGKFDCTFVRSYRRPHHIHDSGGAVRGSLERVGRHERPMRHQYAQRGHRAEASPGPPRRGAQPGAIAGNLWRPGLRARLFILRRGAADSRADAEDNWASIVRDLSALLSVKPQTLPRSS